MDATAQIIGVSGLALAMILWAGNAPLSTVLNRGVRKNGRAQRMTAGTRFSRRERALLLALSVSALPGALNLLSHFL